MTQEVLDDQIQKSLDYLSKQSDFISKDYLARYSSAVDDIQVFSQTLINISVGITGFIIPLLLDSKTLQIDKFQLLISAFFFCIFVIWGLLNKFVLYKKNIDEWPREYKNLMSGISSDIIELNRIKITRDMSAWKSFVSQKINKETVEQKSIFDFDYIFFGIFMLGFLFLINSFFPLVLDLCGWVKK